MSLLIFRPVRSLILLALAVAACGGGDRSNPPVSRTMSSAPHPRGPDALLLRLPRSGGTVRVVSLSDVDSSIWTASDDAPALDRVLGFDREAGVISAIDARGEPIWIDLRSGSMSVATRKPLHDVTWGDGSTVYGIGADGAVARFTPAGNWVFTPPQTARAIFPQPNGTLLILGGRSEGARLWRIHPPASAILDSLTVPGAIGGTGAPLGDRIYLTSTQHRLVGVRPRALTITGTISFDHAIRAVATTPSGDRFFVTTDSSSDVTVVNRYQDRATARIALPGQPRDLRIDPLGRYLLVRAASGDSAWVIAVGTGHVVGTVRSQWRGDLPFVAPDGSIAVCQGGDVVFLSGESLREVGHALDGASDFWYAFVWDGFRPRASSLDTLARFPGDSDTVTAARVSPAETAAVGMPSVDSAKVGFIVSFASLLDAARARDAAGKITVEGQTAHVTTNTSNGTTVYRVVLGPFTTRSEADRVGRASGQAYVIYAESP